MTWARAVTYVEMNPHNTKCSQLYSEGYLAYQWSLSLTSVLRSLPCNWGPASVLQIFSSFIFERNCFHYSTNSSYPSNKGPQIIHIVFLYCEHLSSDFCCRWSFTVLTQYPVLQILYYELRLSASAFVTWF